MQNIVKITCLQTNPKPTIDEAIKETKDLALQAVDKGTEFIFLPEYCGGLKSRAAVFDPPKATEENHKFLNFVRDFSESEKVWIMIGSIAIADANDKYFNRGYIIDDKGKIYSKYDKIHLFDIELDEQVCYKESMTVNPGNLARVANTPFGKIGHTICYDLRFPELFRSLALGGAEVLAVPSAFTRRTGQAHWHVLNRARAIENGAYVVAPCAVGEICGGGASYGHSLIIDPWGSIIADGGDERGTITAEIQLSRVKEVRSKIPSLYNGREFNSLKIESDGMVL